MSVEELLKPRWKVIADYPGSEFILNEILSESEKNQIIYYSDDGKHYISPEYYPAIFQPLKWWEQRSIEDIPKYIKNDGGVYEMDSYFPVKLGTLWQWSIKIHGEDARFGIQTMYIIDNKVLPSTEEEFNSFINNQNPPNNERSSK